MDLNSESNENDFNDEFGRDEDLNASNKKLEDKENNDNNVDEHTDDATLDDLTEKLPTESNYVDNNINLDDVDNSQQTQRSQPGSDRSKLSQEMVNLETVDVTLETERNEELDEENLRKLESDPLYLPGEFPTLPDQFDIETFPLSHRENSLKEDLCLEFVDNFKRQYRHLYGDRKPLFIKPKNECEIEKFVCTSINPTKLPYPEVYDWEGAAKFVAEYLSLVPIVPCTEIPSRLLSPMTTLNLQKGTCFEYSTILCSLLLGVGYNAYVVSGYATREICFMNQSRETCPPFEMAKQKEEAKTSKVNNRYTMRPPKDLSSKFEMEQMAKKEKLQQEELMKIQKLKEQEELLLEQPRDDPLFGQRVHSWVLVLAGKREVGENFFIESLTGKAWSVTCREYLGIESLWNNKNYWVNMQVGIGGVGQIIFDLNNTILWEFLLPGQESVTVIPPLTTQPDYYQNEEEAEKSNTNEKYFDLPKSWTKPIQISLKDFEQRSSEGRQEILYRKAKLEKFAPYKNKDGMIVRCKKYEDKMLSKPQETEEYFQNRNDKLIKRLINPSNGMVSEFFAKGRKSRIAEHHFYTDKIEDHSRKMVFYRDARVDHLVELENSERKLATTYIDREDYLIKRITNFGKKEKKFGPANEREDRRPFETIIEEYSRNPNIPAHKDIHEIIYHITDFRISVSFHTADENIAGDMIEFIKSNLSGESRKDNAIQLIKDSCTYFQIDPFRQKLTGAETYEYYNYLIEKEDTSKESVRNEESEMIDILKLRDSENLQNKLDISLFDRVRNEQASKTRKDLEKAIEDDKHRTKDAELDYLEPFLLQMNINKFEEITKENAVKLYNSCLQDFKERLINKANLLQARFEKETGLLQEKQQWYQQNQNIMQKQDEEEYLQFCNEASFKITTLEKMLARHKKTSIYKEANLDMKMRSDKRLGKHLDLKKNFLLS